MFKAGSQSHTIGYISLFISYNEKRGESTIHQIVMEINVSQRFQYTRVDVSTITFCYYVCKSSKNEQKIQILRILFYGGTPFLTLCTNTRQTTSVRRKLNYLQVLSNSLPNPMQIPCFSHYMERTYNGFTTES